jgi:serine/threonine-protein kinase
MARIGRGGMAGVYAAWDLALEEWRAVKVLLPKHARDKGLRLRFEREGETMKSLQHPNLVRVYDVGSGEKLPFLVMELINAGSLYRWTKTHGAMPARMAVEAMIQLCSGVSAVHAAGVVHRDIKPRNVLVNFDGVLKLTDFGIAQLGDSGETRTGLAMGTLGFMSPEQLHDAKSVDLRTDIYAIGATLWTQLTARKARDLFRLEDKPELMDGVPEVVQPLLARCLAYERADRYPTAKALAQALADLLEQLPEDPPESPPLPLNLSLSFKSKPENTFSEILTTMHPEEGMADSSSGGSGDAPSSTDDTPPRPSRAARSSPPRSSPPKSVPSANKPKPTLHPPPREGNGEEIRPQAPGRTAARSTRWEPDEEVPSYLQGVEQPEDDLRPEVITFSPELQGQPESAGIPRRVRQLAITLVLAPVAMVAGVVVMGLLVAGTGALQVRSANRSLGREQEEFANQIEAESAIRTDLLTLGVNTAPVEQAFARWTQTHTEPDRTEAALEYLMLAEQGAGSSIGLSHLSHEEAVIRQRLDRLDKARDELLAAEDAWKTTTETPQGKLAITLRLAPPGP